MSDVAICREGFLDVTNIVLSYGSAVLINAADLQVYNQNNISLERQSIR